MRYYIPTRLAQGYTPLGILLVTAYPSCIPVSMVTNRSPAVWECFQGLVVVFRMHHHRVVRVVTPGENNRKN